MSLIKIEKGDRVVFSGPTFSGKTTSIAKIFNDNMFASDVNLSALYIYTKNYSQKPIIDIMDFFKKKNLNIYKFYSLKNLKPSSFIQNACIIIDDMMVETDKYIEPINELFTTYAHHRNLIVFYSTQNFFYNKSRTLRLQMNWVFLYDSKIDLSSIKVYFARLGINISKLMFIAYEYASEHDRFLAINIKGSKLKAYSGFFNYFRGYENQTLLF